MLYARSLLRDMLLLHPQRSPPHFRAGAPGRDRPHRPVGERRDAHGRTRGCEAAHPDFVRRRSMSTETRPTYKEVTDSNQQCPEGALTVHFGAMISLWHSNQEFPRLDSFRVNVV